MRSSVETSNARIAHDVIRLEGICGRNALQNLRWHRRKLRMFAEFPSLFHINMRQLQMRTSRKHLLTPFYCDRCRTLPPFSQIQLTRSNRLSAWMKVTPPRKTGRSSPMSMSNGKPPQRPSVDSNVNVKWEAMNCLRSGRFACGSADCGQTLE